MELTKTKFNIFLSYGRDQHASFAEQIKNDLENRGHNILFDKNKLKEGADWEAHIEEGLNWVASDPSVGRFVYIITPHSARKPDGYCLNEIAKIMMSNVKIIPVMLVYCEPPLSIYRIQWLDAQDCANNFPSASYEKTFKLLLDALEQDKVDFEGVQQRLLNKLNPIDFGSDIFFHLKHFTGRKWLVDAVDQWLTDQNGSKVFVLQGGPGVGKTAFSSSLIDRKTEIVGFHLCNAGDENLNDPVKMVKSIAYQISTQISEFRDMLATIDVDENVDANTLFNELIVRPLYRIPNPGRNLFILIDALDEAKSLTNLNEIAQLISDSFLKTPVWLRMIVTTRPEPGTIELLRKFKPYVFDAANKSNLQDIREYLEKRLISDEPLVKRNAIESIMQNSEGNFLYASALCEEIQNHCYDISHPEKFPFGMADLYLKSFNRKFSDSDYEKEIVPALQAMLMAIEPMTIDYLCVLLSVTKQQLNRSFLLKAGSFITESKSALTLFHKSLSDWLFDSNASYTWYIDRVDARKEIGALHYNLIKEILDDPDDIEEVHTYCLKWCLVHLYQARMKTRLKEVLIAFFNDEEIFGNSIENFLDWVVHNTGVQNETLLKKLLLKLAEDQSITDKTEFCKIINEKAGNYSKSGYSQWALYLFEIVLSINERILSHSADSSETKLKLSENFINIGFIYQNTGRSKNALDFYIKSLKMIEGLVEIEPNNIEFQKHLSVRYYYAGVIYKAMGKSAIAIDLFEKSLKLSEYLVDLDPERDDLRRELSVSYSHMGDIYSDMRKYPKALVFYEKMMNTLEELSAKEPSNLDFRRSLLISFSKVGRIYDFMSLRHKAMEFFEKCRKLTEELVAQEPWMTVYRKDLSICYSEIGNIYKDIDQGPKAIEFFEKALKVMEYLVDIEPDRTDFQRELSSSYYDMGAIYSDLGQDLKALEYYEKDLSIMEDLVNVEPGRKDFRKDLSMSFNKIGHIYKKTGQGSKALEFFEKSLKNNQDWLKLEPSSIEFRRELWASYDNIGDIFAGMGLNSKALEFFEKSLEIKKELIAIEPHRADYCKELSMTYKNVGYIYEDLGKGETALEFFKQSLKINKKLLAIEPGSSDYRKELSISNTSVGNVYEDLGQKGNALQHYREALKIAEELVILDPGRTDFLTNLSTCFTNMGIIYSEIGQIQIALEFFEKSFQTIQELVDFQPSSGIDYRRDLSVSYINIGNAYEDMGLNEKALDEYKKSMEIMEQLVDIETDRTDFQLVLSNTYNNIGNIYLKQCDTGRALEYFSKSLNIGKELMENEANRTDFKIAYANSHWKISQVCSNDEKFGWLSKAKAILQPLIEQSVTRKVLPELWEKVNKAIDEIEK